MRDDETIFEFIAKKLDENRNILHVETEIIDNIEENKTKLIDIQASKVYQELDCNILSQKDK